MTVSIYSYPSKEAEKRLSHIKTRSIDFNEKDVAYVKNIIDDVKNNGDDALLSYINKFDAPDLTIDALKVTEEELTSASGKVSPEFLTSLDRAVSQVSSFHMRQRQNSWFDTPRPGAFLGQMVNPVGSAGVYVPGAKGGETPLVSTVIMGVVPAKTAGVERVVITTPPRKDKTVDPHILAAAERLGVTEIYKMGSAWAVAAMTYGTQSVKNVDVIVGPGNIFVTIAKSIVSGTVGIDLIAGPSEILVISDDTGNPAHIAADLLSQAEHDKDASSILVVTNQNIAKQTANEIENQLRELKRKDIAKESLENYGGIFVTQTIDDALKLAERMAPEHLELIVKEPFSVLNGIKNAGAVFMGPYTPEPMGDYIAGPNHVLPTAGTARFSSALSVDHFIKKTSVIHYSKEAFLNEADDVMTLAEVEGLEAHARSVKKRME